MPDAIATETIRRDPTRGAGVGVVAAALLAAGAWFLFADRIQPAKPATPIAAVTTTTTATATSSTISHATSSTLTPVHLDRPRLPVDLGPGRFLGFSPDSSHVLVLGSDDQNGAAAIERVDIASGERSPASDRLLIELDATIEQVAFRTTVAGSAAWLMLCDGQPCAAARARLTDDGRLTDIVNLDVEELRGVGAIGLTWQESSSPELLVFSLQGTFTVTPGGALGPLQGRLPGATTGALPDPGLRPGGDANAVVTPAGVRVIVDTGEEIAVGTRYEDGRLAGLSVLHPSRDTIVGAVQFAPNGRRLAYSAPAESTNLIRTWLVEFPIRSRSGLSRGE